MLIRGKGVTAHEESLQRCSYVQAHVENVLKQQRDFKLSRLALAVFQAPTKVGVCADRVITPLSPTL